MKNSVLSKSAYQYALNLIKRFEGCSLKAYRDSVNVLTIGYGHTKNVKENDIITQKIADDFLMEDVNKFLPALDMVKINLSENQKVALISLIFNIGINNFSKSTLLKKLNKDEILSAAQEFDKWVFAKGKKLNGLVNRRRLEKSIFLSKEFV